MSFSCQTLKNGISNELTSQNINSVWNISSDYMLGPDGNINEVVDTNIFPIECCNKSVLGPTPNNQSFYYWQEDICYLKTCPSQVTCITCDITDSTIYGTFNWWNNLFIQNHNGQSLQTLNPVLWNQLTQLISSSGSTFYVNATTGDLINEACCSKNNGTFQNGVCLCVPPEGEGLEPKCISKIDDLLNLISTDIGYDFFRNNFLTIGTSLGLTPSQINFIMSENNGVPILISDGDINNNNILDKVEARLLLTNAFTITGGFNIYIGKISNKPYMVSENNCQPKREIGNIIINGNRYFTPKAEGFWDGSTCMCKPLVTQCSIDLLQVQTYTVKDFYNKNIEIVIYNLPSTGGTITPISKDCCNKLVRDNPSLTYVWQDQPNPYCYARPKEDCLPVTFSLNEEVMSIEPCENGLEISMWVNFGSPANPCQPLPLPPEEIITISGESCNLSFTPNTGSIVPTNPNPTTPNTPTNPTPNPVTTPCCYNSNNPIIARIKLTNSVLNDTIEQTQTYNSSIDGFGTWKQIKAKLPTNTTNSVFGVELEIIQGLSCCCDYDIFIDDIRVDCFTIENAVIIDDNKCPGFKIHKVIDNKKSWVYNPGDSKIGTSDYDISEREDGSFGTIAGEGSINRTFAPSPDADIPWRYTNYWDQSSVYENHSKLVINSKELWLTYDMCADCFVSGTTLTCPNGYILSANTNICYSGNT